MDKRKLPWFWYVGIILLLLGQAINLVNLYALESPQEWISITGTVVSVASAILLVYSARVVLKKKRVEKAQ